MNGVTIMLISLGVLFFAVIIIILGICVVIDGIRKMFSKDELSETNDDA